MVDVADRTPSLAPVPWLGAGRVFWMTGIFFCVIFAISAALYPVAVASGSHDLWAGIQAALTSKTYTYGARTNEAQHPLYLRALGGLTLHTVAGAIALMAATTQFMPFVRRRWPLIHRMTGICVVGLVAASMVGSIVVQLSHPLSATLSGAGFGIGLISLCGLTLVELTLAVLAVRAGAYRTHMGWMALMYASLLTAPALRVQWLLAGYSGLRLDEANIVIATYLIPMMILVMAFWMGTVAVKDLGLAAPRSILPPIGLRALAVLAAIVAVHEGCLAPLGIDIAHAARAAGLPLARNGMLWGLGMACLAWRAPVDIERLRRGETVRPATVACALLVAIGGLVVAWSLSGSGLQVLSQRSLYAASSIEIALLIGLGRRGTLGLFGAWDMQWLYLAFAPALWPALALSFVPLSVGAPVAVTIAMADAYATIAALGFASAFGLAFVVTGRRAAAAARLSVDTRYEPVRSGRR